jgi:hypothetical protein
MDPDCSEILERIGRTVSSRLGVVSHGECTSPILLEVRRTLEYDIEFWQQE